MSHSADLTQMTRGGSYRTGAGGGGGGGFDRDASFCFHTAILRR